MRSSNVLFLSNSGELAGGGEHSLLDLVSALLPSRFRPLVVCPNPGPLQARLEALGVSVEVLQFPAWRSLHINTIGRTLGRLAELVRAYRIALLHCNATWRIALCGGLVGRWCRVPVIWHVRVGEPDGWKDRLLGRLATRIVVNSDAVARRFAGVAEHKVQRIHNGIDLRRFVPCSPSSTLKASLRLPPQAAVVGSVGRFVPYKGYHHLLDAAAIVRQKRPDVHWVLVGDGELREKLEGQCQRLGLATAVRFIGWQERVSEYLALFDVFVLPSLGEHFGRVLLEAMAMERAVVATNAGGVPEIVLHNRTGILVPPAAPATIAAAVEGLLDDRALAAQLGRAARQRVAMEFSLARHVECVEALYAEVTDSSRGR